MMGAFHEFVQILVIVVVYPFLALFLSLVGTAFALKYLKKMQVVDIPNARSSHVAPTPRGAGIVVSAVIILLLLIAPFLFGSKMPLLAVLAGAAVIYIVSALDDVKGGVNTALRFSVQLAAVVAVLLVQPLPGLVFQGWLTPVLDMALTVLCWLWFVNLFNFMDGIDGITGMETVFVAGGVGVIALLTGLPDWIYVYGSVMAGAAIGFLWFNWHPAKVFLGDSGSVTIGFITGFLLLNSAAEGYVAAALILPMYYLVDASFTLFSRLARGKKIWQAHKEHAYQKAVQGGMKHSRIVLEIASLNLLLAALALAVVFGLLPEVAGVAIAAVLALALTYRFQRRLGVAVRA